MFNIKKTIWKKLLKNAHKIYITENYITNGFICMNKKNLPDDIISLSLDLTHEEKKDDFILRVLPRYRGVQFEKTNIIYTYEDTQLRIFYSDSGNILISEKYVTALDIKKIFHDKDVTKCNACYINDSDSFVMPAKPPSNIWDALIKITANYVY